MASRLIGVPTSWPTTTTNASPLLATTCSYRRTLVAIASRFDRRERTTLTGKRHLRRPIAGGRSSGNSETVAIELSLTPNTRIPTEKPSAQFAANLLGDIRRRWPLAPNRYHVEHDPRRDLSDAPLEPEPQPATRRASLRVILVPHLDHERRVVVATGHVPIGCHSLDLMLVQHLTSHALQHRANRQLVERVDEVLVGLKSRDQLRSAGFRNTSDGLLDPLPKAAPLRRRRDEVDVLSVRCRLRGEATMHVSDELIGEHQHSLHDQDAIVTRDERRLMPMVPR